MFFQRRNTYHKKQIFLGGNYNDKFIKKTLALVLVLTTVFMLSTAAFAVESEATTETYLGKTVCAEITYRDQYLNKLLINIWLTADSNPSHLTVWATVDYVYCPEDAIRPSNYISERTDETFGQVDDESDWSFYTGTIPDGHVMISATLRVQLFANSPTDPYNMNPVTIYPY